MPFRLNVEQGLTVCRKRYLPRVCTLVPSFFRLLLLVSIVTCLMGQKWALIETESEPSISQMYGYNAG